MKIDLIFSVNHTENSANHLSPFISEVANNTRILPSAGMCFSRVETFLSDIYGENKKFKKRAHDQRSESSAREYHSDAAPRILAHILKWTRIKFLGSLDVVFIYWPFSKNYESALENTPAKMPNETLQQSHWNFLSFSNLSKKQVELRVRERGEKHTIKST